MARNGHHVYIEQLVPDRMTTVSGYQVIRDKLQLDPAFGADFAIPSAVVSAAHTNCGDRANAESLALYRSAVGARFATLGPTGIETAESFTPPGGVVPGETLAHVAVGHTVAIKDEIMDTIFRNPESFFLFTVDSQCHVGQTQNGGKFVFGMTSESKYEDPRAACGAVIGALEHYDHGNMDHVRIRALLGEDNFRYLSGNRITTQSGIDITPAVASSIIALRGMYSAGERLKHELRTAKLSGRGAAELTAATTVNIGMEDDLVIPLGRLTIAGENVYVQGLGTDARAYGGSIVDYKGGRLALSYDGCNKERFSVRKLDFRDSLLKL